MICEGQYNKHPLRVVLFLTILTEILFIAKKTTMTTKHYSCFADINEQREESIAMSYSVACKDLGVEPLS